LDPRRAVVELETLPRLVEGAERPDAATVAIGRPVSAAGGSIDPAGDFAVVLRDPPGRENRNPLGVLVRHGCLVGDGGHLTCLPGPPQVRLPIISSATT